MSLHKRATMIGFASLIFSFAASAQAPQKRAINFRDLISMHRLSDPQISPDGHWVAYAVATPDLDANRSVRNIWVVPVAGGESRQITTGGSDERPRWSPDGKKLAFSRPATARHRFIRFRSMAARPHSSLPFQRARTTNCGRRTENRSHSFRACIPIAKTTPATPSAMHRKMTAK